MPIGSRHYYIPNCGYGGYDKAGYSELCSKLMEDGSRIIGGLHIVGPIEL